jgi:hypothetical protein
MGTWRLWLAARRWHDCLSEITRRKQGGQTLWAVNGTAKYLRERGLIPDGHVIVDARPDNIGFLEGSAPETTHYLASQCHPSLFDLKPAVLWHANSPGMVELLKGQRETTLIGGGSTVGLQALVLAFVLGYRKIHLYGFDSSYRDGEGHAYAQPMNSADPIVTAVIGGRSFRATPWMVQQTEEFVTTAAELEEQGAIITVHGDGMLPFVANEMPRPMTAAEMRAHEVLSRLGPNPYGAELGVFTGAMSAALLARPDVRLLMVDSWEGEGAAYCDAEGDFHAALTQDQQDGFRMRAEARTAFAQKRREILAMRSARAAAQVADGSLDFVFIDADHSYDGCKSDIAAWLPKVKAGGWLCGHDYRNTECPFPGVERAVDEFAAKRFALETGENFTWFIRIPETARMAA